MSKAGREQRLAALAIKKMAIVCRSTRKRRMKSYCEAIRIMLYRADLLQRFEKILRTVS